jgi:DNA-binding MarR family transcriptional regulator
LLRRAEHLRFAILAAQREGNRLLARALKPLGVTPSQAEVLRLLHQRGTLTLTGVGQLLVCESGTNPSRLVDRLAAAGLVNRRSAAGDRRHVELSLTPAGEQVATSITEIEDALYDSLDTAAAGHDTDAILGFLHSFVDDLPAGHALARRLGAG